MYTTAELRAVAALHEETTVSDLAAALDRSTSYVSELVDRLESKGLVHTTRAGKTRQIHRSDARAIELFDSVIQEYPHVPFPELLGGATLRVLYGLDAPAAATDLATRAGVHRSTVHRTLSPLEDRGIVYRTDGEYALTDEFAELATLARAFAHHRNRHRVEMHADSYAILWESLDEFLVRTDDVIDADAFHLTGPERFQEYELALLARQHRYYLYSEATDALSPADLCCHMLVIDDGPRSQSYCLLLLSAADVDRELLLDCAAKYDVDDLVEDLLAYLATEGEERTDRLPAWTEFRALADEYGVAV